MARDETPDPHLDPVILRHRREAFSDGYSQACQDAQSWLYVYGEELTAAKLLDFLIKNHFEYRRLMVVAPQLDKAIAEAEAGRTVDRGDFTQYLEGENDCTA